MTSDDILPIDQQFATALSTRDYGLAADLLARGARINLAIVRTETFDRDVVDETTTYLIDAARAGALDTVRFLLEHGADPNLASVFSGRTALLEAARFGQAAAVDLLLASGADLSAVDRYTARTAIGYATEGSNPPIVRSLLAAGAPGSFSQLNFSIEGAARAREVVRLLTQHQADINKVDDWGRTPLMWAAQYAEAETIQLMIELGAEVNRMSEANMNGVRSDETALSLARSRKRRDIAALLLRHGAHDDSAAWRSALTPLVRLWDWLTR